MPVRLSAPDCWPAACVAALRARRPLHGHDERCALGRPALTPGSGSKYQRREVERSTLYQVVRDHLETFYQAVEDGFASAPLPDFVKQELERFLDCGVLCRGAALLVCDECPETKVIALSCNGRGFCPSCLGRRMAQSAANLVDHVLPDGVPLRQWVLTVPFELRARLGFDAELLSELCGVVNAALLGFYERALSERAGPLQTTDDDAPNRRRKLQSGTVTVVQRTSADLRLNPHLHIVALDGVFAEQPDGPPRDPRTGASETHYDAQGRIDYLRDAGGHKTEYGHDAVGRKNPETNAAGKHSYFAYDARGQLIRTWETYRIPSSMPTMCTVTERRCRPIAPMPMLSSPMRRRHRTTPLVSSCKSTNKVLTGIRSCRGLAQR